MRYPNLFPKRLMRSEKSHTDALKIYDQAADRLSSGHAWTLPLSNGDFVHFCWGGDDHGLWSREGSSIVYTDPLTGPRDHPKSKSNLRLSVGLLAEAMKRGASIRCVVLGGDKTNSYVRDVPTELRGRVRRADQRAGQGIEIVFEVEGEGTSVAPSDR